MASSDPAATLDDLVKKEKLHFRDMEFSYGHF